jgi:hypothetical protein
MGHICWAVQASIVAHDNISVRMIGRPPLSISALEMQSLLRDCWG